MGQQAPGVGAAAKHCHVSWGRYEGGDGTDRTEDPTLQGEAPPHHGMLRLDLPEIRTASGRACSDTSLRTYVLAGSGNQQRAGEAGRAGGAAGMAGAGGAGG
eukprot:1247371-Rhodomonas_salina.1